MTRWDNRAAPSSPTRIVLLPGRGGRMGAHLVCHDLGEGPHAVLQVLPFGLAPRGLPARQNGALAPLHTRSRESQENQLLRLPGAGSPKEGAHCMVRHHKLPPQYH
jgi:hypothetical protein